MLTKHQRASHLGIVPFELIITILLVLLVQDSLLQCLHPPHPHQLFYYFCYPCLHNCYYLFLLCASLHLLSPNPPLFNICPLPLLLSPLSFPQPFSKLYPLQTLHS